MTAATELEGAGAFFQPAANTKPFLKVGARGFAGTGKTFTLTGIAIELVHRLREIDPSTPPRIAFFDTEKAAGFLRPMVEAAGLELFVKESRSLSDWQQAVHVCEGGFAAVLITDSITHIYQGFITAYQQAKNRKRLEFQDWGILKPEWQARFAEPFVRSRVHILFTGRAGYEYEQVEVEKYGGGTKKEIQKSGVKMKADADTAYEPDLILHMDRVEHVLDDGEDKHVYRECTVLKDRSGLMDGQTFKNPKGADFRPIIDRLITGPTDLVPRTEGDDRTLFDDREENQWKAKRDRTILVEEVQGLIAELYPGQSAADKQGRQALFVECFGTRSWTAIENSTFEALKSGKRQLEDKLAAKNEGGGDVPPPSGGALAQDRRSGDNNDEGAGGKDAPLPTDGTAPSVDLAVVKPIDDLTRQRLRKAVLNNAKREGYGEKELAQFLTDQTGRDLRVIADATDTELQAIAAALKVN